MYLGSLMRVVAMRLKMEKIQFGKLCHPSDGLSSTSVSTYLQNNVSGCPQSNPQCVRLRAAQIWPIAPLYSHRETIVTQGSIGIMTLPW